MQENRWQIIEKIFNQALEKPFESREEFVRQECGDDEELCWEILLLVENDSRENCFLSQSVFTLGAKLLNFDFTALLKQGEFAGYKLQKLLGKGGMGAVFLAQDERLERLIALKILPPSLTENNESVLRFQQEAKTASNVSHQNVAHIYEFGQHQGLYYLAMEYVRGHTLRELIREKLISPVQAVEIALQIASALQAAHRAGIVHRDIKPENIIVQEDGTVKVLDFGIAKLNPIHNWHGQLNSTSVLETMPGLILGTVAYMSPEQVRGQSLDERSDIWSLGVVFYEMLIGSRPFSGDTSSDTQSAILRDQPPSLPSNLMARHQLNAAIKKSLEKDRLERYQTVSDFKEDLNRVLVSLQSKSKTVDSAKYWITRQWLRRPALVFAGLLTLAFGLLFSLPHLRNIFWQAKPAAMSSPFSLSERKIDSLVILPLRVEGNLENEKLLDSFSLDLARELNCGLGSANAFRVKSLQSGLQMQDVQKNFSFIKNKLNVGTILRGNITGSTDNLEVEVELIDTSDGAVLWQDSINADKNSLFKLRKQLLFLITRNFQPFLRMEKQISRRYVFFPVEKEREVREEEAYQLYLSARYLNLGETGSGIKSLERAAVELNHLFRPAYLALAMRYYLLAGDFYKYEREKLNITEESARENAKSYLQLTIHLDKDYSDAHLFQAQIKMDEKDWVEAERELQLAIESNPNNHWARFLYGKIFLPARGRFGESIKELETAFDIDPLSSDILSALAQTKILKRDYEGAIKDCDNALAISPENVNAYSAKSMALMKLARFVEATQMANKAVEQQFWEEGTIKLGVIYGHTGQTAKAQEIIEELEQWLKKGNRIITDYDFAVIYAAMGMNDKAFQYLEKEVNSKSEKSLLIRFDPLLERLRDNQRFAALESTVKFFDN